MDALRKIICTTIIFLMLSSVCSAFSLSEQDKKKHVAASTVAGAFGVMIVDLNFPNAKPWQKWLGSTAIGLIPGVVKEATDDKWDWQDMAANTLGAASGSAAMLTITWTW